MLRALCLALLLFAAPAESAVLTIGTHHQAALGSNALPTSANDCPPGSIAVIFVSMTSGAVSSVTDNVGNPWTVIDNQTGTSVDIAFAYTNVATDLPIASTITATLTISVNSNVVGACITGGLNKLDLSNITNQGTAATTSATLTGTPNFTNEVMLGGIGASAAWTTPTCTGSILNQINTQNLVPPAQLCAVVSASTPKTMIASWTTSANYVQDIISFYISSTGVAGSLSLTGVGH